MIFFESFAKSTLAWKLEMSPVARAAPWASSRHQRGSVTTPAPAVGEGSGSWLFDRNATLKNAGGFAAAPAPPGWVASAVACGSR